MVSLLFNHTKIVLRVWMEGQTAKLFRFKPPQCKIPAQCSTAYTLHDMSTCMKTGLDVMYFENIKCSTYCIRSREQVITLELRALSE